jgi:hypothetical protein
MVYWCSNSIGRDVQAPAGSGPPRLMNEGRIEAAPAKPSPEERREELSKFHKLLEAGKRA